MASARSGSVAAWRWPREGLVVAALLVVLVGLNVATAHVFPVVWLDEAQFVDPAANLAAGLGFRSSAWPAQAVGETWLSYMPLYPLLLSGWLKLFGVSLVAVRSFGHLLGAAAIGAVWLGARRHGILRQRESRIAFVAVAACGAGLSFSYRCGRGDTVTFALLALAFLAASDETAWRRRLALVVLGAFVPISGLQGLAFVLLAGVVLLPFAGRRVVEPVALVAAGGGLGLASFALALRALGLWETFHRVILAGRGLGGDVLANVVDRLTRFPRVAIEDQSAILLALLCLAGLLPLREGFRSRLLGPQAFGAVAAAWIPTLMCAAGRYALYYAWMAWVPLCLATLRFHEEGGSRSVPPAVRRAVLLAAALVGLPLQLAIGFVDREARSTRGLDDVVAAGIAPGAVAYCDPAAYYGARRRASRVILTSYGPQLTPEDVASVGAVVARSGPASYYERVDARIEELWQPMAAPVAPEARVRALKLHWTYVDYAGLRAWERRREPVGPAPARD